VARQSKKKPKGNPTKSHQITILVVELFCFTLNCCWKKEKKKTPTQRLVSTIEQVLGNEHEASS
jgi:hypothetical protein